MNAVVVVNTTPWIALAAIDRIDLLERCFGQVVVPSTVAAELRTGGPIPVPDLANVRWVTIASPACAPPAWTWDLDAGERDVLALAVERNAAWTVLDERLARNLALLHGRRVVGTLGILHKAVRAGWLNDFRAAAAQMTAHGIHYHPALIERLAQDFAP